MRGEQVQLEGVRDVEVPARAFLEAEVGQVAIVAIEGDDGGGQQGAQPVGQLAFARAGWSGDADE